MLQNSNNTFIKRKISSHISDLLKSKFVLLSGPRQVGKTFLSRHLLKPSSSSVIYLNYDDKEDRKIISEKSWSRDCELVVLDELHKKPGWKTWLKSLYDKEGLPPQILVTGSARLNTFKKGGDSLAGRHYSLRLTPLSLGEISEVPHKKSLDKMISSGSFPEPYLETDPVMVKLWRKNHLERILKEDLLDLERVHQIKKIELLVQLLSERVGSPINVSSLGRDLEVSAHTIKHWLQILEDLYVIFKVSPYSKNLSHSLLKSAKYYFYDTGRVANDFGSRLENISACHLLSFNNYLEDALGETCGLYYVRDKSKREVDFLLTQNYKPQYLIEVKSKDSQPTKALKYFDEKIQPPHSLQLVYDLHLEKQYENIKVKDLTSFLHNLTATLGKE